MKTWLLAAVVCCTGAWAAGADATNACLNLVGTYAEPGAPAKPVLTIIFTNGQFAATDASGKKTIVSATPTARGLVMVEDPKDRNVFRLAATAKPGVFFFEYLGHHKAGQPLPEEALSRREVVRVPPPPADPGRK